VFAALGHWFILCSLSDESLEVARAKWLFRNHFYDGPTRQLVQLVRDPRRLPMSDCLLGAERSSTGDRCVAVVAAIYADGVIARIDVPLGAALAGRQTCRVGAEFRLVVTNATRLIALADATTQGSSVRSNCESASYANVDERGDTRVL